MSNSENGVPIISNYPAIDRLANACLHNWPEHEKFLRKTFSDRDEPFMQHRNELAQKVLELVGDDLASVCDDYRWTCMQVKEEQYFFHKNGRYRLRTLSEAVAQVYGVPEYMRRYVNGLLISQVFWQNHAYAFYLYCTEFLPRNVPHYAHLDVGPGHGLFAAFTLSDPNCESVTAWDVSRSSLDATDDSLKRLKVERPISLVEKDVVHAEPTPSAFDSVVMSELLEHLERPDKALRVVFDSMRPGGRLFLNVPVNSPALDHLFLWHDPKEVVQLTRDSGFEIERNWAIPMTGHTLESAKRLKLDVSSIIIARKPKSADN